MKYEIVCFDLDGTIAMSGDVSCTHVERKYILLYDAGDSTGLSDGQAKFYMTVATELDLWVAVRTTGAGSLKTQKLIDTGWP